MKYLAIVMVLMLATVCYGQEITSSVSSSPAGNPQPMLNNAPVAIPSVVPTSVVTKVAKPKTVFKTDFSIASMMLKRGEGRVSTSRKAQQQKYIRDLYTGRSNSKNPPTQQAVAASPSPVLKPAMPKKTGDMVLAQSRCKLTSFGCVFE